MNIKDSIFVKTFFSLLVVFVLLVATHITPNEVLAQQPATNPWYDPSFIDFKNKVNDAPDNEIFGERYTYAQVNWIISSLALIQGGDMLNCFGPGIDTNTCINNLGTMNPSSPLLFIANLNDAALSVRPASGINYIGQKIDALSPVKVAHAQEGFGFTTLEPLRGLWVTFRDISYGLMAFGVVILAFLVILRQKISAQVVLSVQSALPRIAVAFLFITFSYAIAGFIIDLAYLVMAVFSAVVASSGTNLFQSQPEVLTIFGLLNDPARAFSSWSIVLGALVTAVGAFGVGATVLTGGLMLVPSGIASILGLLLLTLGLVALLRVFITMLRAFATVVFLVIGSPFIGVLSIFGAGPGFGGWVKQLVAQLAVFVTICIVMFVSHMMFWTIGPEVDGWAGDLVTGGANYYNFNTGQIGAGQLVLPGFAGFPIQIMAFFIGFGLIFSAPKIAGSVRDQILSGRGSYGFDTTATMLGAGIPFVGGLATGKLNDLQKQGGNWLSDKVVQGRADILRSVEEARRKKKAKASEAATSSQSQSTNTRSDVDSGF